jgi:hypothetical protein
MTKLEEVARALWEQYQVTTRPWIDTKPYEREKLISDARAAVQALRVPSEAIHAIILDYNDLFTSPDDLWESLIDAILKEKK